MLHEPAVVEGDGLASCEPAKQPSGVFEVDDRKFLQINGREPLQRGVQVVFWRDGDDVSHHDVPGNCQLPDRLVEQIGPYVVVCKNADHVVVSVHSR